MSCQTDLPLLTIEPTRGSEVNREFLTDGWTLTAGRGPVPEHVQNVSILGTVPGCVHTDLLAAGMIADPYLDNNESALSWIGLTDWTYTHTFQWQPGAEHTELVFEGLDTIAMVSLNGELLGRTRNMHRRYTFDITDRVRSGANELTVDFS